MHSTSSWGRLAGVPRLALCTLLWLVPPAMAQVPSLINYQGAITSGGAAFNGSGQFNFALVNPVGTTTLWSNDGTSVGGAKPVSAVTLTVTNGVYTVALGDTALANMTTIPATVFTANGEVRLRVWFDDGTNGAQQLAPDQRVMAVGYAIRAGSADTVANGAVTKAALAAAGGGAGQVLSTDGANLQWATASALAPPPPPNPLRVAMLRWYEANQAGNSFNVGSPGAVTFDGANMWFSSSGTVTKLRASDGACNGVANPANRSDCTFNVGGGSHLNPPAVAFDGANVWVSSGYSVTKLRASDGACNGVANAADLSACMFFVNNEPYSIAFDGANVWIADDYGHVTKLRARDGACGGVVNPLNRSACMFSVGTFSAGIAFDGTYVWVADRDGGVKRLLASDGSCGGVVNPPDLAACTFATPQSSSGLAFDGTYLWITVYGADAVVRLRASDGSCNGVVNPANLSACTFAVGDSPHSVVFDGTHVWVSNGLSGSLTKLRASDGACAGVVRPASLAACSYSTGTPASGDLALSFDGANVWVLLNNGTAVKF